MGRVAFVFSGQGDQHPGMGAALCERYPVAAEVFAACDVLRPDTSRQCFSGTAEELRETVNTQPCLFAMEMAAAQSLKNCGLSPDAAAGFSLGEMSALTFAGAMSFETGFTLVCRRGELMQRDAEKHDTVMAAVLKLSAEQVEAIAAGHEGIYPVNYNCLGQISVAGLESAMAAFYTDVKAAGGRVIPLKVRGAFHSPFMRDAAAAFADELDRCELHKPAIKVYSDVTAAPYPEHPADVLKKQMCAPVQWERIIRNMVGEGITTFVEIGPGKTLCGLIARIAPEAKRFAVADYEHLEELYAEVAKC